MEQENAKRTRLIIAALVLTLAFAFQGSRGLWEPDEGRYVRCSYEMQKTGNWLVPQINYEPHFTKPPTTYWLIAAGIRFFGRNEWGARVFHGLAFALTAMLVGLLGERMWDRRTGLFACLSYATMILPFLAGNAVTTDTILTFFETLAIFCFWMSVSGRENAFRASLWSLTMWLSFGLAFLTKGPPGLLPLASILAFLLIYRSVKRLPAAVTALGLLLFIGVSASWFVAVTMQYRELFSYLYKHELIGRIFSGEQNRNPGWLGPFKVYLPTLLAGPLPWAAFWPRLLAYSRPRLHTFAWWRNLRERPNALFLVLWFSIPLAVFCLASSRLPLYVLPLYAPLALASSRALVMRYPDKVSLAIRFRGKPGMCLGILILILLISKGVAAHVTWKRDSRAMWTGIKGQIEEKVGDAPYEIAVIRSNYLGLAFYSGANVESVTTKEKTRASTFAPVEHISEEYEELASSRYVHVLLVRESDFEKIVADLKEQDVSYSVTQGPFRHFLIFCDPKRSSDTVWLAVLGDAGTGTISQDALGWTLYHVDQGTSLDGILLLGDNVVGWDGGGDPARAYRKYFERPYAPLIENLVPFYAALGNHDLEYGKADFQTNYPLFNMEGRRYYSRMFGDDLVEVFFLDSNTIRNDPQQVEWLTGALEASVARWKVVAMHHPIYSSAKKNPSDPAMIDLLEPLFLKTGVNLVLAGHNHVYERLRPIHGIQYMTVGSSGKLRKGDLRPECAERIAGEDCENVTLVLKFAPDRCCFSAYTLNERVIDEGKILHPFVARPTETQ